MTTIELILTLPEPVLRRLEEAAAETRRSIADVAAQSIAGNLPPMVPSIPPALRDDLIAMLSMPDEALQAIARSQVADDVRTRHVALLERAEQGMATPDEHVQLAELREAADAMMLRKAHAWSILRWRGHPVPTLAELPIDPP